MSQTPVAYIFDIDVDKDMICYAFEKEEMVEHGGKNFRPLYAEPQIDYSDIAKRLSDALQNIMIRYRMFGCSSLKDSVNLHFTFPNVNEAERAIITANRTIVDYENMVRGGDV